MEIERKFLVVRERLLQLVPLPKPDPIVQGYLSFDPEVRVRVIWESRWKARSALLTVKGKGTISRLETNVDLTPYQGVELLDHNLARLEKRRYRVGRWEIDEFGEPLTGLWLAEIELTSEEEVFERPEWLGAEVTHDTRFKNQNLARSGKIPVFPCPCPTCSPV